MTTTSQNVTDRSPNEGARSTDHFLVNNVPEDYIISVKNLAKGMIKHSKVSDTQ